MIKTLLVILVFSAGQSQSSTDSMIKFDGEYAYEDCIATKEALVQSPPRNGWLGNTNYVDENLTCIKVDTSHRN